MSQSNVLKYIRGTKQYEDYHQNQKALYSAFLYERRSEPALNTQRFATVLTHQLTRFIHAEYHYCVTVYQFDVKSELQSVCKENLKFTGFTIFSLTHTSIDMHSSCRIPLLRDCLSIWCAIWATKCLQIWHWRVVPFPPKSHQSNHSHIHRHTIVMQPYHYCVTVYRSDVQSEIQSIYNFDIYKF